MLILNSNCRNFGLLSFGFEAEVDEEETDNYVQQNASKAKSTHDILDDPKLSKETITLTRANDEDPEDRIEHASEDETALEEKKERIKNKLKKSGNKKETKSQSEPVSSGSKTEEKEAKSASDSDSDDLYNELEKERREKRQKQA